MGDGKLQPRIMNYFWVLFLVAGVNVCGAAASGEFNRAVRPILSDKCYSCHGPDARAKHIPFRLDREEEAKAKLPDGKYAISEGHPEQSEIIARITTQQPALQMPPVYTGVKLSPKEVGTIQNWITEGGTWEKHWSFQPPKRYFPPNVNGRDWVRNPIDAFVL